MPILNICSFKFLFSDKSQFFDGILQHLPPPSEKQHFVSFFDDVFTGASVRQPLTQTRQRSNQFLKSRTTCFLFGETNSTAFFLLFCVERDDWKWRLSLYVHYI